jgi:hypothetical protein
LVNAQVTDAVTGSLCGTGDALLIGTDGDDVTVSARTQ